MFITLTMRSMTVYKCPHVSVTPTHIKGYSWSGFTMDSNSDGGEDISTSKYWKRGNKLLINQSEPVVTINQWYELLILTSTRTAINDYNNNGTNNYNNTWPHDYNNNIKRSKHIEIKLCLNCNLYKPQIITFF